MIQILFILSEKLVKSHTPFKVYNDNLYQSNHLIEQPILGICSDGPNPVLATCFIASNKSRLTFSAAVSFREASNLPLYCNFKSRLKPKKSGVQTAPYSFAICCVESIK